MTKDIGVTHTGYFYNFAVHDPINMRTKINTHRGIPNNSRCTEMKRAVLLYRLPKQHLKRVVAIWEAWAHQPSRDGKKPSLHQLYSTDPRTAALRGHNTSFACSKFSWIKRPWSGTMLLFCSANIKVFPRRTPGKPYCSCSSWCALTRLLWGVYLFWTTFRYSYISLG